MVDAGFQPPSGIQYVIIQQVHVPDTDIWLENEAFRITGNPLDSGCNGTTANRFPTPCQIDPCAPDCPNGCDPGGGGGGGGGGGSTPDIRKPSGTLTVFDNRLNNGSLIPVRRIRVVARNFLKTERVYTNEVGRFTFTKRFNKVNLVVKMKNNNTQVRGIFGARVWNLFWTLKKNIGKYRGELNNIQYTFFRQENAFSRGMQDWVGVTAFNKRTDYDGLSAADNLPTTTPSALGLFITPYTGAGSAPMFPHRAPNNNELLDFYVQAYIALGPTLYSYASILNELVKTRVDILYGYGRALGNLDSDDISEVMFHELSHSQHYQKVGNEWWGQLVVAELTETFNNFNTPLDPYGPGNTVNSPRIALAESWAYHYGRVLADRVYGINFSSPQREQEENYFNGFPVATLSSHLNLLEDFDPGRANDPFRWIPQGLYYDMIDDRNDLLVPTPRVFIDDDVSNYTNLQFFNALDNDITSLPNYRARLLQENANNQSVQVTNLFSAYGY